MEAEYSLAEDWNQWRTFLADAFKSRQMAAGKKDFQTIPAQNHITALFLQVKGFNIPEARLLPELMRIIDSGAGDNSQFDGIAMLGHRIGIIETPIELQRYLQDILVSLRPEGQALVTSISRTTINGVQKQPKDVQRIIQFQQENLIGPYFSMLKIKAETLTKAAVAAGWQCEPVYQQDNLNYLIRLKMC